MGISYKYYVHIIIYVVEHYGQHDESIVLHNRPLVGNIINVNMIRVWHKIIKLWVDK